MGLRTSKTIDVPGEDGEYIEVKYPSQLRVRALKAQASAGQRLAGEEKNEATGWNLMALVLHDSIVGWSYKDAAGEPVEVTPGNIDDLDNRTAGWLFNELMGRDDEAAKKAD